jgi:hypothetical protein
LASKFTSQDVSALYLGYLFELQANANNVSAIDFDKPPWPDFSDIVGSGPTPSHLLWFAGLASSLSSAVLATLLQSWIRRFVITTQLQHISHSRARFRAYVSLEKSQRSLQLTLDLIHLLLDVSIFTFLAGLFMLVFDNLDICVMVSYSSMPLIFLYLRLTMIPPYHIFTTPLNFVGTSWRLTLQLILRGIMPLSMGRYFLPFSGFGWLTVERARRVAEELVKSQPLLLDREIVAWLLRSLHQDQDFERFLESIPGFYGSEHVKEPTNVFRPFHTVALPNAIVSFMHRTSSSVTLPDETKQKRIRLSLEVIQLDPYLLQRTFFHVLSLPARPTIFQCIDFVLVADRSAENEDTDVQLLAKCVIAIAISSSKDDELDPRLSPVVARWLNMSVFDTNYHGRGANMKLINLVQLVQVLNSADCTYRDGIFGNALCAAGRFGVNNAVSEYRNRFCILWNELVGLARMDAGSNATHILPCISDIFAALHEGTIPDSNPAAWGQSPADYPRCPDFHHYSATQVTRQPAVDIPSCSHIDTELVP